MFAVFVAEVTEYETSTAIREKGTDKKQRMITIGIRTIRLRSARNSRNSTRIAVNILNKVAEGPRVEVTVGSVI